MSTILYLGEVAGMLGGIERYCCDTARLLRRHGHHVHFLGNGQTGRLLDLFQEAYDQVGTWQAGLDLIPHADLIIVHKPLPESMLRKLPIDRTYFLAHDHQLYCRRHHYYTPLGRTNCHRAYSPLRCWLCALGRNSQPPLETMRRFPAIVLSHFMADNLVKNGFRPEDIQIIPPFISCPVQPSPRPLMPQGILRLLFLGQLIRGKGADLMLESLKHLKVPFQATVVGDGKDRHWLERLVQRYGLSQRVCFTGWQPHPETYLQHADLLLFPSRWQEPFGLVGLEALAQGVPALGFDVGGVREWLRDQLTGRLCPEGDTQALAQAITDCYHQPRILEAWSQNARQVAQENFSAEHFIKHLDLLLTNRLTHRIPLP